MLDQYTTRIDAEVERFQAEKAKLHHPDGTPVYTEPGHTERVGALLSQFDDRMRYILAKPNEKAQNAERTLKELSKDPFERLTADDLARANQLREFVKEDVESASFAELAEKLGEATTEADTARRYLLWRYAYRKAEALAEKSRQGGQVPRNEVSHLDAVSEQLQKLETTFLPADAAKQREGAEAAITDLREIERYANRQRYEIDGTFAREVAAQRARAGLA